MDQLWTLFYKHLPKVHLDSKWRMLNASITAHLKLKMLWTRFYKHLLKVHFKKVHLISNSIVLLFPKPYHFFWDSVICRDCSDAVMSFVCFMYPNYTECIWFIRMKIEIWLRSTSAEVLGASLHQITKCTFYSLVTYSTQIGFPKSEWKYAQFLVFVYAQQRYFGHLSSDLGKPIT